MGMVSDHRPDLEGVIRNILRDLVGVAAVADNKDRRNKHQHQALVNHNSNIKARGRIRLSSNNNSSSNNSDHSRIIIISFMMNVCNLAVLELTRNRIDLKFNIEQNPLLQLRNNISRY
jgi:hypothetical protein